MFQRYAMENKQNDSISVRKRTVYIVTACLIFFLIIAVIIFAFSFGMFRDDADYFKLVLAVIGMLFAAILFVFCCFNIRDNTRPGHIFTAISVILFFNILLAGTVDTLDGTAGAGSALLILQTITAVSSAVMHILFWRYQCASLPGNRAQRYITVWIYGLTLCYFILLAINPFTGILFIADSSGNLVSTGETLELIFFSLFYLTYLLYILPQRCRLKKKLSLASFAFFPLLCVALTAIWYVFGITYTLSSVTYLFLLMAAYVVFFGDYLESKALLLRQKTELAEKERRQTELKTAIMLSQIQPHFLYNALNAISSLCETDAMQARDAIDSFAAYLRMNMNSLESSRLVPFTEELEHTRTYLNIEKLRFGDELKVIYDIRCDDFQLPPLCVQPLAENAVKHGLQCIDGGVVKISTLREGNTVHITVCDNGVGYTPGALREDDREHIGIENVRARLAAFCGGTLTVCDQNGEGTVAEIILPEETQ